MREILLAATLMAQPGPQDTEAVIQQYRPTMPAKSVQQLARAIHKAAGRYGVDPDLLTAILAQESGFQVEAVSCYRKKLPSGCYRQTCDIGVGQINWEAWGQSLRLNPCRLRSDATYNIDVAAKILARVRRGNESEANWWSRYHDARPKFRAPYETLVLSRLADSLN